MKHNIFKTFILLVILLITCSFVVPTNSYEGERMFTPTVEQYSYNTLGVIGYTDDGVAHDDGSPDHGIFGDFWNNYDYYEYYWDDYNNQWLRYNPRNDTWDYWTYTIFIGWHWTILDHHVPQHEVQRAYKENQCPLDGEVYILFGLAVAFETYQQYKRKLSKLN